MPEPALGRGDDVGEPAVQVAATPGRRGLQRRRREHRVPGPRPAALGQAEDPVRHRRLDRVDTDQLHQVGLGELRVQGDSEEQRALVRREVADPEAEDRGHLAGEVQRLAASRQAALTQRPADLEDEQRVAPGLLPNDPQQALAQRQSELLPQETGRLLHGQRLRLDVDQRPTHQRRLESGAFEPGPSGQDEPDGGVAEPARGVRQGLQRGRVGPLDVVDEHHHLALSGQPPEHVVDAQVDGLAVDGRRGGLAEQRHQERVAHRLPQRDDVELDVTEQVLQHGEGVPLLALARGGPEHARPALGGQLRGVLPEHGLAPPGFPSQDQPHSRKVVEEVGQQRGLTLATDQGRPPSHGGTVVPHLPSAMSVHDLEFEP